MKDMIFFVCYGGGHSAAVKPVIKRLKASGQKVTVLALTTARPSMMADNLPAVGVKELIPLVPGYSRCLRVGRILVKSQMLHPAVEVEESCAYLGVGFHSLVKTNGLIEAKNKYLSAGRHSFLPISFFIELFKRHRPSVVVATNSPRYERAALEAARELNIPSVCIVDLYAYYEIQWCATKNYARKICVLNEQVRERFEKAGVPSERLRITGNPAFDRLAKIDRLKRRGIVRQAQGIDEARSVIVWISQPEPNRHPFSGVVGDVNYPLIVESYLFEVFGSDPNLQLVMRLHPSESRPPAVRGDRVRYSNSSEFLDDLLCSADCVITASSTVGLEAALLGLPVIQCMDSIFSQDLPLAELGVATAVNSYKELEPAIRTILATPAAHRKGPVFDGAAASKVESAIMELLEPRPVDRLPGALPSGDRVDAFSS